MAPSDNSHTVYEVAYQIDSDRKLDEFIDGLKTTNWCDQAEGNRPDSSDTSGGSSF